MNTTYSAIGQRQTDRLQHIVLKHQPCEIRNQGQPSEDFYIGIGNGKSHEA